MTRGGVLTMTALLMNLYIRTFRLRKPVDRKLAARMSSAKRSFQGKFDIQLRNMLRAENRGTE